MRTTGTATVLFTDIVGSTELRGRLGEDLADELRRTHDVLLAQAIAAHGGVLVKGLGDGVMATFGSAVEGVEAAISIQQAIDRHSRNPLNEPLALRVGLSIGDVVWEDDDCFGDPVIEASRLCATATPQQILAADVVRVLARQRGQSFRPIGDLELKGVARPVAASEVLWEPLAPEPAGLPMPDLLEAGVRLRFSGREESLETANQAWKRSLTEDRQVVLLAGEPGIGKTRLAREAALRAHEQGAVVLYGRCEEDLGAPYQPFVEALGFFLAHAPVDDLTDKLGRYAGELARLCPVVADLAPGAEPPLRADAETERYRLFEAVAAWLSAAAEPAGLVLVLDDLHWATKPTLVLLQHVLHAAAGAKLLVLVTYRDTDLDRQHPLSGLLADLRRQPGVTRLALTGLDVEGVMHLVADAAGHELDESGIELARVVQAETEGNPFFVGEILRHLRESGVIFVRDGRWVSDVSAAEVGIPEGIREVVGRRLDRLSDLANQALLTAAVVGRDFELPVVATAAGLDEDDVVAGLDEAVRARLIDETGVGSYRFAHALVRSTLYDELRATRRSRLHAKVAAAIELLGGEDPQVLAHHYVQAGDVAKGAHFSQLAGDDAGRQLAHDRAVDFYRQALELIEDDDEHAARRCSLMVALGDAQRRSGDPGYRETLLAAGALARSLGQTAELIQAALANSRGFWSLAGETDDERIAILEAAIEASEDDSADRARLLAVLSVELMFGNEAERRHELSDQAIAIARRTGDRFALADVLSSSVPSNYVPWRMPVVLANVEELIGLTAELGDPQRWAMANLWRFVAGMITGDIASADPHLDTALAVAEELGEPALRWLVTEWSSLRLLLRGELDAAAAQLEVGLELGQRTGQPDAFTWYAGQLWALTRERGGLDGLLPIVEEQTASNPGLPAWLCVLGLMYVVADRLDDAQRVLEQLTPDGELAVAHDVMWICAPALLIDIAERTGDVDRATMLYQELLPFRHLPVHGGVTYLGSAEKHLASGARAMGRLDDAVEHLEAAIALEERMGAPTWLGVACADLALTLRSRGAAGDLERADEVAARAEALAAETGSVYITRRLAGHLA